MDANIKDLITLASKKSLIDLLTICQIDHVGVILEALKSRFLRIEDKLQTLNWDEFVAILENIPATAIDHQNDVLAWVWDNSSCESKVMMPNTSQLRKYWWSNELGRDHVVQLLNMPASTPEVADYIWQLYCRRYLFVNDAVLLRRVMKQPKLPLAEKAAELIMQESFRPELRYSDLIWIINNYPDIAPIAEDLLLSNNEYDIARSYALPA
ncbi:hypothetical protein KKE14_00750 [Patescibacteria group bacterium]|nr:hypothetical protein [Patescibacteria group bacterium]